MRWFRHDERSSGRACDAIAQFRRLTGSAEPAHRLPEADHPLFPDRSARTRADEPPEDPTAPDAGAVHPGKHRCACGDPARFHFVDTPGPRMRRTSPGVAATALTQKHVTL